MEKTTVITKLDFRALKYCNLFIMKYKRKTSLWFLATALISLAVVVYDVFFVEETNYMFAILGGIFILYSGYQYINLEKRLDTQLVRFFSNRKVTEQTIEVTDEKVKVTRSVEPNNPAEFDWSFVTEILEMPQYYMLMVGRGTPIIIDRSVDAIIEGSKENLDAIIKEKASMKPYKQTEVDIVKIPITFIHPEFPEVVSSEVVENPELEESQVASEDERVESEVEAFETIEVEAEEIKEDKKEED